MPSLLRSTVLALFLACLAAPVALKATPLIALRESENCGGCHKPGRGQRPVLERRCTLDCQGCHIDPSGGSARNQWGYYYSMDQASMVSFFSPIDPLQDQSRFDLHVDSRIMQWDRANGERETFPMNLEGTVRVRPFVNYLHFTYQPIMMGRIEDDAFRILNEGGRRYRENYAVMVDNLPLNTYVRAYRGPPMYGLRRPNHSLWIRQRIGLDQFATTDAYELGGTPNVPFFRVSSMKGDPYTDAAFRQKGTSFHGGMRGVTLGWHVNTSLWKTQSDFHKIDMKAFGAGANIFNFILYGERNWRDVTPLQETSADIPLRVQPSSTINEYTFAYGGIRGLMFGVVKENLDTSGIHSDRQSLFVDVHPIPWVQIELWRRRETGARNMEDTLGLLHLYADF